ncbi:MAG: efflux RND transporter periplasmic adaptor subunit [Myxococcales bacterium]|nr:efflux RND transporter periplasmic adaptor subunit [Myxococcales bacterium]
MQGNRVIALSLAALTAGVTLSGCGKKEDGIKLPAVPATVEAAPLPVDTAVLRPTRIVLPVRATGNALASRIAEIGSPLSARVEAIAVHEGDVVDEDAVLVRLDDAQARLQASQAQASATAAKVQADQAQADQARLTPLAERGSIAHSRIEQLSSQALAADANARAARTATSAAQRLVRDATVRAPFAGTVVDVNVELGEMANRAPYLVRLVDLTRLEVTVRVHARELSHLAVGDTVVARFPDLEREVAGELSRLGREVDAATRTVEVVAAIDNPDRTIPSGAFVEVEITPHGDKKGLIVPRSAVATTESGSSVYAVEGGVARARAVTIRSIDSARVEITDGVQPGVTLVMSGVDGLVDGAKVAPRGQTAANTPQAPAPAAPEAPAAHAENGPAKHEEAAR